MYYQWSIDLFLTLTFFRLYSIAGDVFGTYGLVRDVSGRDISMVFISCTLFWI